MGKKLTPKLAREKSKKKKLEIVKEEETTEGVNEFLDDSVVETVDNKQLAVISEESKSREAVQEVLPEDLKDKDLRKVVQDLRQSIDKNIFEIARVLYFIKENQEYKEWGYASFQNYIEEEFSNKARSAFYYVSMHEKLIKLAKNKEQADAIKSIGYTKAKEILTIATPESLDEWIKTAKKCGTNQVIELVKKEKKEDKTDKPGKAKAAEIDEIHKINFKLFNEQFDIVEQALSRASEQSGSKDKGYNLQLICMEYLATSDLQDDPRKNLEKHLQKFCELAKIKVVAMDRDTNEVLLGKELLQE